MSNTITWIELALYLNRKSISICCDNECTENNHNCGSYAYINIHGNLSDICIPDYFVPDEPLNDIAAIPLPFNGTYIDLKTQVEDQIIN